MGKLQTILIDDIISSNPKFRELLRTRKLSQLINAFLKEHLNVVDEVSNKAVEDLQDDLSQINVRKAILLEKIKSIEEQRKKELEEEEKKKPKLKWERHRGQHTSF